jgi:hypothetical protein
MNQDRHPSTGGGDVGYRVFRGEVAVGRQNHPGSQAGQQATKATSRASTLPVSVNAVSTISNGSTWVSSPRWPGPWR